MTDFPTVRNLDGVYYRIQRNGKWQNICYSDLTQTERDYCTKEYDRSQLKRLADYLADALHQMGDALNVVASMGEGFNK